MEAIADDSFVVLLVKSNAQDKLVVYCNPFFGLCNSNRLAQCKSTTSLTDYVS